MEERRNKRYPTRLASCGEASNMAPTVYCSIFSEHALSPTHRLPMDRQTTQTPLRAQRPHPLTCLLTVCVQCHRTNPATSPRHAKPLRRLQCPTDEVGAFSSGRVFSRTRTRGAIVVLNKERVQTSMIFPIPNGLIDDGVQRCVDDASFVQAPRCRKHLQQGY